MNDLWKTPPPPPDEDNEEGPEAHQEEREPEPDRYEARHRASGRPPLIRRKARRLRDQRDFEEPTGTRPPVDELLASRPEDEPRWTGEETSAMWPRPPEVAEDRERAGAEPLPSRSELRRTRRAPEEAAPRPHDYVGRHLAPKKRTLFARPSMTETDEETFLSREEIASEPPVEEGTQELQDAPEPEAAAEIPELEIPEAEIPEAEIHETEIPEAEIPEAEIHETEIHETEIPETEIPEAEIPELEIPEAEIHEPEVSEPAIPEVESPVAPEPPAEAEAGAPHLEPLTSGSDAAAAAPPETVRADEIDDEVAPPIPEEAPAAVAPPPPASLEADLAEAVSYEETLEFDDAVATPAEAPGPEVDGADDEDSLGPRRKKLQRRRRRARILQVIGSVLLSAALVVGAIVVGGKVIDEVGDDRVADTTGAIPTVREPVTTLIFGTRGQGASKQALWMTLLTYDPEDERGAVVYIPSHTAVEVPGRGLQGVGESYSTGGVPLLLVSAENLLGVTIDRYIELSDTAARDLFDAAGSLSVNVPNEVRVSVGDDEARLILVEGQQEVDPSLLVKMLYLRGIDGDDVELGSRHLAFWDALLDRLDQPEEVEALVQDAPSAFEESDASLEDHQRLLNTLAALPTSDLTITTLPVRPISAGESELYAADEAEIRAFLTDTIGFAAPAREDVRVQVLNGNGVPGIGQDVARRLVGEGFRVILSGNARRLTYRRTLIITYDATAEGQRLAERAKRLLGVGEVQVSAQQQGIVDLTIVVGKDFLRAD